MLMLWAALKSTIGPEFMISCVENTYEQTRTSVKDTRLFTLYPIKQKQPNL